MRKIADSCSLKGCTKKYDSIGYCAVHAQRYRRHGDVNFVKKRVLKDNRWKTPEYRVWINMRQRCSNPKHPGYKYWGGKGIRVCDRWLDFFSFLEDMGKKPSPAHSIDRIDGNGDYSPENCRWATRKEQVDNRYLQPGISGFSGVTPKGNKWMARKLVGGKRTYLGVFSSPEEAAVVIAQFS